MDQAFRDVADPAVEEDAEAVEGGFEGPDPAPRPARVSPALAMARAAAERAAAKVEAEPAAKGRAWGRDAMMLVRRSHLYAGLLLYPWVLLYGITAFLFNHPMVFSDQTIIQFGRDAVKGTPLEGLPRAADVASKVVAAINARGDGKANYALTNLESARFERGVVAANVKAGDGKSYTVTAEPDGGVIRLASAGGAGQGEGGRGEQVGGGRRGGRGEGGPGGGEGVRRGRGEGGPGRGEGGSRGEGGMGRGEGEAEGGMRRGPGGGEGPSAPFAAASGVTIEGPAMAQIREALPAVLARAGLAGATVADVRLAPLTFQMEGEGGPWQVTYNALFGSVSGRPVSDPAAQAELSTRRFLLRLHMIHGYPSEFGQRWMWAFIVDLMAFLMVFWGVSGIIMWWQIKRTRRIGAAALALSTAAAVWIGVGMHGHFVNGGR